MPIPQPPCLIPVVPVASVSVPVLPVTSLAFAGLSVAPLLLLSVFPFDVPGLAVAHIYTSLPV